MDTLIQSLNIVSFLSMSSDGDTYLWLGIPGILTALATHFDPVA